MTTSKKIKQFLNRHIVKINGVIVIIAVVVLLWGMDRFGYMPWLYLPRRLLNPFLFIIAPYAFARKLPCRKQLGGSVLLLVIYAAFLFVGEILATFIYNSNVIFNVVFAVYTVIKALILFLGTAVIFLEEQNFIKNIFKMRKVILVLAAVYTGIRLYDEVLSYLFFPQELNIMNIMLSGASVWSRIYDILMIIVPAIIFAIEAYLHPKERRGGLFAK
jgi:hypothetical protein